MATRMERLREYVTTLRDEALEEVAYYEALLEQPKASKPARRPKSGKSCCTKKEVIEVLEGLLRDNGALSKAELEDLAKDKLGNELGKNLSGFAMRMKEALAGSRFMEVESGKYALDREIESLGAVAGS